MLLLISLQKLSSLCEKKLEKYILNFYKIKNIKKCRFCIAVVKINPF